MKKIILIYSLLFFLTNANAQVAGYMGKRFCAGYANYFSPRLPLVSAILENNQSDKGSIGTERFFNTTHNFITDFIISDRVSLCATFQFSKMDHAAYSSTFYASEDGTYQSHDNKIIYLPAKVSPMQLKTRNFSLGFKFFKNGSLNPIGRYRKIEFILATSQIQLDEDGFYWKDDHAKYDANLQELTSKSFVFAYTIGKQRVLGNAVVLDYGLRAGLNYGYANMICSAAGLPSPFSSNKYVYDSSLNAMLTSMTQLRLFEAQLINFHIGFHFLSF